MQSVSSPEYVNSLCYHSRIRTPWGECKGDGSIHCAMKRQNPSLISFLQNHNIIEQNNPMVRDLTVSDPIVTEPITVDPIVNDLVDEKREPYRNRAINA